jgi:putative copper export protein
VAWLKGSPMANKLASRSHQVQQDAQALIEAGANQIFANADVAKPLISDLTAKWVAATLLSRAFNLEIPTQNLNGV